MPAMLIVEDDDKVRSVLYELFSDWEVCHVVGTAELALAYLGQVEYDVILTDLSMPGMSGVELLGQLRERHPGVPVVVISGIDDAEHARGLPRLGVCEYVTKPFRLEEVEAAVARTLAERESGRSSS